ncbi:MAG: hypothetical protein COT17_01715 [Elusimicrobia bacterium CG08_land_8_20_14_0_20_51_18]|nr:MAG: hypothetical protein COT17_01715 [Elusimicrobia bacterium CG08_land_8_20_14_0_20_51_18]
MPKILRILYNIRTPFVLLYFLVFVLVSKKLNGDITSAEAEAGLLFFVLMQLSYLLNKVKDMREDVYNGEALMVSGFFTKERNLKLLISLITAYLSFRFPVMIPIFVYGVFSVLGYRTYKGIFVLKSLAVAFGFFLSSVLAPCLVNYPSAYRNAPEIFINSLPLVTAVFFITVLFDMRDRKGDSRAGLKTIPVVLGERKTLFLILSLMFFSLLPGEPGAVKLFNALNYALIFVFVFAAVRTGKKIFYEIVPFLEIVFLLFLIWKL